MRWEDFRSSENVEDRRGMGGVPGGAGGLGIGAMIILGLIGWVLGIDPRILISGAEMATGGSPRHEQPSQRASRAPRRSDRAVRGRHPGQHRGRLEAGPAGQVNRAIPARRSWCCSRARPGRAAAPRNRPWGRSTARWTRRSTRPVVLPGDAAAVPGRRRLRLCLRDRARGRPPRPEPARPAGQGAAAPAARSGKAERTSSRSASS